MPSLALGGKLPKPTEEEDSRESVANSLRSYRFDDAVFRDDARDERMRRNIKGWIVDLDPIGRSLPAETVRDLAWIALLDGYAVARRQVQVESARRSSDIKRNAMRTREQG